MAEEVHRRDFLAALGVTVGAAALGVAGSEATAAAAETKEPTSADYIIVGLGTAGAVLARYLSEPVHGKFKNSVLVLEAGQNYSLDPVVTGGPNQYIVNADELTYNPKYSITSLCPEQNPIAGLLPAIQFSQGRGWFGTSSHNGMAAVRGSSDFYNDLAQAVGNNKWFYTNLLPYMKFLETFTGTTTQPEQRGTSGPLLISQSPPFTTPGNYPTVMSEVTGAPLLPDYNVSEGNTCIGTALQNYATDDGNTRVFGYHFLPTTILQPDGQAVGDRQLTVKSGAVVKRVIFSGNTAIGVEYVADDGKIDHVAYARKKVILCAGCPFSAAILQRSGVGPLEILNDPKVNIPVVVAQPLVGTGLKDHYGVIFAQTQPTDPADQLRQVIRYFVDGRNYYIPAGAGDKIRRIQGLYFPTLALLPAGLLSALNLSPFQPGITGFLWNLQPRSSGTADIIDSNPFTFPEVRFKFYTDGDLSDPASDLSVAVAMLKLAKGIADSAGAGSTMLYPSSSHYVSDAILAGDAGAQLTFSQFTVTTGHYTGTCNMGPNFATGVVSSEDLHVFGTENLMVADNSIFPFPETGNTAWTAYLAGLMAAHILGFNLPH